jgi:hypothetical protein
MLNLWGSSYRVCDGVTRRDFLRVGALGFGGLTMADLLRLRAQGAVPPTAAHKAVIMVYLPGGPSHIDMYDLKPAAPQEFRGEFRPIRTNVPGIDICELMTLQAQMADKFSLVRNLQTFDTHSAELLMRGTLTGTRRPVFGSIVSKLCEHRGDILPPYVALGGENGSDPADPTYLGTTHRPFTPGGPAMESLRLGQGLSLDRLDDRRTMLTGFDNLRRDIDNATGTLAGLDAFSARALDMIRSPQTRLAFDLSLEPEHVRRRYGPATRLLLALRLVQAGVSVVTVSLAGTVVPGGDWDTHAGTDQRSETNFSNLRRKLPVYDRAISALLSDLYSRGLDQDVVVVVWGEFGRTPRINANGGRDHWAPASFALVSGGGLNMGQVVGDTGPRAERSRGIPYTPANLLATLYRVLGIDLALTLPDYNGRPMYLLDDRRVIEELV